MAAVDDYFAGLDAPARTAFERIRALAGECASDAEQGVSYGMAALRYRGKPLLGFKEARTNWPCSVQPGRRRRRSRSADRLLLLQGHDPVHPDTRCPTTWSATWSGSG